MGIMTDSLMFQEDDYVVLTPGQPEEILTAAEMLAKLELTLAATQLNLPTDVSSKTSIAAQAAYLLVNYCELDLDNGQYLHWYAVRLEKN
jgi:Protein CHLORORESPIRATORY REDUCTION 7